MTTRTMTSSDRTGRPRPSKRPRDSNSVPSPSSFHPHPTPSVSPAPPLALIHKRYRSARTCQPYFAHYRGPGPPCFISNSSTLSSCSSSSTSSVTFSDPKISPYRPASTLTKRNRPIELPDEVLVSIFRFIERASKIANLRTVCKQWCKVIDNTPEVWRIVSFKNANFSQPVACSNSLLTLGRRPGRKAVTIAARSGNEWARFLKKVIFDRRTLRAVTIPQPTATLLVSGERPVDARPFPPWVGDVPDCEGTWVAIHAARRSIDGPAIVGGDDMNFEEGMDVEVGEHAPGIRETLHGIDIANLPCGAMVGMVHVRDAFQTTGADVNSNAPRWIWRIDRAVRLKKPIRCAGFVGLWSISGFLTDLLVNAFQKQ